MHTLLTAIVLAAGAWVPAPSAPWDVPAGARCDFPVHAEPVVDEVKTRVLARYPDGSTKREAYVGDLVLAVTNTDSGETVEVDLSGSALVEYQPGGTLTTNSTWYVVGPALFGFREGGGNRPRGIWVFDGVYTVAFDANGVKTVTVYHGSERELCTELA
ncbi:hypothetical protein RB614_07460 [Phytohabitans sp. ZYX-F-186]|uniref:Uncharacterized protein n=1 Tax=Phytohabitans maris TaxID=3071409 RepID=A0ABU0ZBI9_9ACTN|nr:hypothetical protein [Phytohabitans sp. ZYX-F-186]MDQ7904358.1 hypothetical protein [Phytohabitans sp. ZYX-F-186]